MNPMWKVYKSKVLKTINPEYEEGTPEEVTLTPSYCFIYESVRNVDVVVGIEVRKSPGFVC